MTGPSKRWKLGERRILLEGSCEHRMEQLRRVRLEQQMMSCGSGRLPAVSGLPPIPVGRRDPMGQQSQRTIPNSLCTSRTRPRTRNQVQTQLITLSPIRLESFSTAALQVLRSTRHQRYTLVFLHLSWIKSGWEVGILSWPQARMDLITATMSRALFST